MSARTPTKALGEGIDQQDGCRYDPNYPQCQAYTAETLAERRDPEHRHSERNETYRHEPYAKQRIEYALSRLPQQDECRLILGGRSGSMIEVGDRSCCDMWESPGREHAETHNSQDAPEESWSEARPPKCAIQVEEVGDPKDEDHQVEAILYRARRSDVGEPDDLSFGFGRICSHEHDHYNEDDNEDDATQHTGETTQSENAFLLLHCIHLRILPLFDVLIVTYVIRFGHRAT
jgi:hypothetical protein